MQLIEAPDEFWDLMDENRILENMSQGILQSNAELTDQLYERAYNLEKRARKASSMAWKIVHDAHPELNGRQMSAAHGTRKIHVD